MAFRTWAWERRVQYGIYASLVVLVIAGLTYIGFFYRIPTCFDGRENGDERGRDCGGACNRVCAIDVMPPVVQWVQSFRVVPGQYNVVAYVENRNQGVGTPELSYTFTFYNEKGDVITTRPGTAFLPPDGVYPIFEGRIIVGDQIPVRTVITLDPVDNWQKRTIGREQFDVRSRTLLSADKSPKLETVIYNNSLEEQQDMEIVATIFDIHGKPLTASQSVVPRIGGRASEKIVFTWPEPIATTVRSCEVPSDILILLDRSGSMATDGGDPPEPLESAKRAASQFVSSLQDKDQVGYLSYATIPTTPLEHMLTKDRGLISQAIAATMLGTDGVQYTNIGDAIQVAAAELVSIRHNENARKILVLLTDGDVTRPNNPSTGLADREYATHYALEAARKAKEQDITIYTIGLGKVFSDDGLGVDRDVTLIQGLASGPGQYHVAPSAADLTAVYQEISTALCEEGPAVIDIVPKAPFDPSMTR